MKTVFKILLTSVILIGAADLQAACIVRNSNGQVTDIKTDALFSVLQKTADCPENVQSLKKLFKAAGNNLKPAMVANRGIHNPNLGSFSFFEEVVSDNNQEIHAGELFFGHFTDAVNGVLVLDQKSAPNKLLIELIAWDQQKKFYNFYELIGTATGGQWFYRGDSADILNDNKNIYLDTPSGSPQFGNTLRCSACHTSGGPIMKEISFPHNDWWTKSRPLDFGKNKLSQEVSQIVSEIFDAEDFSQSIKAGIHKLEDSTSYQKLKAEMSLQVQLRPLFCETEINLESDSIPLQSNVSGIQIPSASVINPFFMKSSVEISKSSYLDLLALFRMNFPETINRDADHAWLVPVKGYSDLLAIQSLIKNGVITEEFAADVLAVDIQNPLFSVKRCSLLKLLPVNGGPEVFAKALKLSNLPQAQELYKNLTDPEKNMDLYNELAKEISTQAKSDLESQQGQKILFEKLISQRQSVFESVISKNPRGQILEPGFRVIFPIPR